MRTQNRSRRCKANTARLIPVFLISLLLSGPIFSGTVYKCVAEDGGIVYQQTPCCEEEREEQLAFPEFMNGKDGRESVHAESIKALIILGTR